MATYKCMDCSHEIISGFRLDECEICGSSKLALLESFSASKKAAATTIHAKATSVVKVDHKSESIKSDSSKSSRSESVGCFKSLVAILLGGLIPSWNLLTIVVFTVSKSSGNWLFLGTAMLGSIWGFTVLRKRSWIYILSFGILGVFIYFLIIIVLVSLGFIKH